jgi:signal peptidase I
MTARIRRLLIGSIIVAVPFVCFAGLYAAGYRLYRFPGHSMRPTIHDGERFIGRLSGSYRHKIKRFDVIIFRTHTMNPQIYAKRVVGLSGERVTVSGDAIAIDGAPLSLPQSVDRSGLGAKPCNIQVPKDAVFVLGDYPHDSLDSRWTGPIWKDDVIGSAVFKK